MRRVQVEWIDSLLFHDGWQDADFYTTMLEECAANRQVSVGFVAAEEKRGMILVQSRDADSGRLCNATWIPAKAIVKVTEWPE